MDELAEVIDKLARLDPAVLGDSESVIALHRQLTRLDAESQLSKNPLSTGRGSGIVAIAPPAGYPQAVWDELVRLNKLKKAGQGQYELVAEPGPG